ncbi:hypothetical protein QZH41_004157 [Actinostola sp. cb2023]|nr:hypothetical protein QZH41_004157 [Actinostola sp. cb2023]
MKVSVLTRIYFKYETDTNPNIAVHPQSRTVLAGSNVTLTCNATGSPVPDITWKKNGNKVSETPVETATSTSRLSVLHLINVQEEDVGVYTCYANNSADNVVSNAANVTIGNANPNIIVHPESRTVLAGSNATLTCNATGSPVPDITWKKNGNKVSETPVETATNTSRLSVLYLINVQEKDVGVYTCYVNNSAGNVVSNAANITIGNGECLSAIPRLRKGLRPTAKNNWFPLLVVLELLPPSVQKEMKKELIPLPVQETEVVLELLPPSVQKEMKEELIPLPVQETEVVLELLPPSVQKEMKEELIPLPVQETEVVLELLPPSVQKEIKEELIPLPVQETEVVLELLPPPVQKEMEELIPLPVQETEVVLELLPPSVQKEMKEELIPLPVQETEVVLELLPPPVQKEMEELIPLPVQETEVVLELLPPSVQKEMKEELIPLPVQETEVTLELLPPPVQKEMKEELIPLPVQETEVVLELLPPPVQKEMEELIPLPVQGETKELLLLQVQEKEIMAELVLLSVQVEMEEDMGVILQLLVQNAFKVKKKKFDDAVLPVVAKRLKGVDTKKSGVTAFREGSIIADIVIIFVPLPGDNANISYENAITNAILAANTSGALGLNLTALIVQVTYPMTPIPTAQTTESVTDDGGLEGWQIALIVIFVLILIGIIAFIAFLLFYKRNTESAKEMDEYPENGGTTNENIYDNIQEDDRV